MDIEIKNDPYVPKNQIFFFNFDIPKDLVFNSQEEKIEWMVKNGHCILLYNVGEENV